jgi:hypothetical protein
MPLDQLLSTVPVLRPSWAEDYAPFLDAFFTYLLRKATDEG